MFHIHFVKNFDKFMEIRVKNMLLTTLGLMGLMGLMGLRADCADKRRKKRGNLVFPLANMHLWLLPRCLRSEKETKNLLFVLLSAH